MILILINLAWSLDHFTIDTSSQDYNELTCPKTKILNETGSWNDNDRLVLKRAKFVCSSDTRYKNSPCLKVLIKKSERNFLALCGSKDSKSFILRSL